MKALHWKRIIAPSGQKSIWKEIKEPKIDQIVFAEKFAEKPKQKKKKKAASTVGDGKEKKQQKVRVLEGPRSNNLGIMLARQPALPLLEMAITTL